MNRWRTREKERRRDPMEKWNFLVGKRNFERTKNLREKSVSRHTCYSYPSVILRVFRYLSQRWLPSAHGEENERYGTYRKLWLSSRSRHRCRTDCSMNVCMRYELYALCIERADDKKSHAYARRWRAKLHQAKRKQGETRALSQNPSRTDTFH